MVKPQNRPGHLDSALPRDARPCSVYPELERILMSTKREHQVTVPLDRELWEFVEREAARDDRSLAGRGTFAPMAAGTWTMPSQRGHECRLAAGRNAGGSLCPRMVCTRCGMIGADVRPDWGAARQQ